MASTYTSLHYHLVFSTKHREPLISREWSEELHSIGCQCGEPLLCSGLLQTNLYTTDPTFLLAEVEILETYKLANIDRVRLEKLLHKFFAPARLDLELKDRFGFGIEPHEWFLAPLGVIREAIEKLMDGTIQDFRYDPESAQLVKKTSDIP